MWRTTNYQNHSTIFPPMATTSRLAAAASRLFSSIDKMRVTSATHSDKRVTSRRLCALESVRWGSRAMTGNIPGTSLAWAGSIRLTAGRIRMTPWTMLITTICRLFLPSGDVVTAVSLLGAASIAFALHSASRCDWRQWYPVECLTRWEVGASNCVHHRVKHNAAIALSLVSPKHYENAQ